MEGEYNNSWMNGDGVGGVGSVGTVGTGAGMVGETANFETKSGGSWKIPGIAMGICGAIVVVCIVMIAVMMNERGAVSETATGWVSNICEMEVAEDLSEYDEFNAKYELYEYFYKCTDVGQGLMMAMENGEELFGMDEVTDFDLGANEFLTVNADELAEDERRLWEHLY